MSAERDLPPIRVLGPYGAEDDARSEASRMADIQATAWADWLQAHGVSEDVVRTSLESDDLDAREERLRQAFQRNSDDQAVMYVGAFATSGEMAGFAKFMLSHGDEGLEILLAEIDVVPEYQGKQAADPADHDMAKRMIYSMLAQITHPETKLRLKVLEDNARARRLYEKLGLEVVGESQSFTFEDANENVVHQQRHLVMQGSALIARDQLREMIQS